MRLYTFSIILFDKKKTETYKHVNKTKQMFIHNMSILFEHISSKFKLNIFGWKQ